MPKLPCTVLLCLLATASVGLAGQESPRPATSAVPLLWSRMTGDLTKIADEVDGRVGIHLRSLASGERFDLRGDEAFPAASTIKLALLYELYRQSDSPAGAGGVARLQDSYEVLPKDLVEDSSILGNLKPGTRLTLRDLALFTVVVSDNSATNVLMDRVGPERVNQAMDSLGLRRTRLRRKMMDVQAAREGRENLTSPHDLVDLLAAIQAGQGLRQDSRADLMRFLSTSKDGFLNRLLPESLPVANKPGTLAGVRNDAGIIFVKGQPFLLAVMISHLRDELQGEAAIARIARRAAAYFEMAGATSPEGRILGELQIR